MATAQREIVRQLFFELRTEIGQLISVRDSAGDLTAGTLERVHISGCDLQLRISGVDSSHPLQDEGPEIEVRLLDREGYQSQLTRIFSGFKKR